MPNLYVRGVPEHLYMALKARARAANRSLSAEIITLLASVLHERDGQATDAELLASIRHRRWSPPDDAPNSLDLLREDRQR